MLRGPAAHGGATEAHLRDPGQTLSGGALTLMARVAAKPRIPFARPSQAVRVPAEASGADLREGWSVARSVGQV